MNVDTAAREVCVQVEKIIIPTDVYDGCGGKGWFQDSVLFESRVKCFGKATTKPRGDEFTVGCDLVLD